jgi:MFS family permease
VSTQLTFLPILSLLIGVALLTAGNALLGTLVSLRMALEGFPRVVSGVVMSAYFAGFLLGARYAPRIIDRVGHIRAFAAFAATAAAAATAQALAISPLPWIVLRAAVGFAIAGELMVAESWLISTARTANRGRVFSLYMMAVYLAFGSGQLALALGDPAGLDLFLVATLFLSLSILPIVLTRATAPATPPTSRLRLRRIYDVAPLGLVAALVAGVAVGAVQSIGPQFAREIGLPQARIAWFMGAFFLSGLLLQWPAGHLSDRVDRRGVLAAMALLTAVTFTALAGVDDDAFAWLIGLAIVGGGAVATLYPLSVAHAHDRLREESVVAVTASLLLIYGLGAVAGPILATTLMVGVGAPGLFYAGAGPCLALAGYAAFRMYRHAPVEQDRYESVAQTTPAVLEIDPRAEPH